MFCLTGIEAWQTVYDVVGVRAVETCGSTKPLIRQSSAAILNSNSNICSVKQSTKQHCVANSWQNVSGGSENICMDVMNASRVGLLRASFDNQYEIIIK